MNYILLKLSSFAAKTSMLTILSLGMVIIISSVSIALVFVPTKILAVITVAIGTFIGSTLIASSISKITSIKLEEIKLEKEQEIKSRIELENAVKKAKEIENERDNLQQEINNLKNMKLDVNSISRIMELGVAKAEITLRDFCKTLISEKEGLVSGKKYKEYVGLIECKYTAKLGVNLLNLKILEHDKYIEVSGLKTETLGICNRDLKWLLQEIREIQKESKLWNSYKIENASESLIKYSENQAKQMNRMIENGVNLKHFDEYITRLARDFIILLLAPLQKEIRFISEENNQAKELVHFFQERNEKLEEEITMLQTRHNHVTSIVNIQ